MQVVGGGAVSVGGALGKGVVHGAVKGELGLRRRRHAVELRLVTPLLSLGLLLRRGLCLDHGRGLGIVKRLGALPLEERLPPCRTRVPLLGSVAVTKVRFGPPWMGFPCARSRGLVLCCYDASM